MRISDWSSDVCSSDLVTIEAGATNATNRRTIAAIRTRLMAEHLGVEPEAIVRLMTENGDSIIAVIEQVRGKGKTLVPSEPPPLNEIEKKPIGRAACRGRECPYG